METMDGPLLRHDFRVLAVDSDIEHLLNLTKLLRFFNYQVITCQTATGALSLLRKSTNEFQILLADVALPDSDGFDLLSAAMSEFPALQVVLFSNNAEYETAAVRALELGACAFYTKPIPPSAVEHVWQHVFRRNIESLRQPPLAIMPPPVVCTAPLKRRKRDDGRELSVGKTLKKTKAAGSKKKPRLWSPELHAKFVAAVEVIGADNLSAGKILKVMEQRGVVGLSEPQVSSHLQQYRKLGKSSESSEPTPNFSPAAQEETATPSSAVESSYYLFDDQMTSADFTTTSSQATSYGVMESSEGCDFDWSIVLSSLENQPEEVITNLLAST